MARTPSTPRAQGESREGPAGLNGRSRPGVELTWPGKDSPSPPSALELECIERHGAATADNRLLAGDNLAVMQSLLPEFEGRIDLIYLDPPFATGANWSRRSPIGDHRGITTGPAIVQTAYQDMWPGGLSGYLDMLWPRLQLAYRLLSPTGAIVVHVGWQVNAHVRMLLDECFGSDHLVNEIVWHYQTSGGAPAAHLIRNHATLWHYAKGDSWTHNHLREPWPARTLAKWQRDECGQVYRAQHKLGKRYYVDPAGKRADDVWEMTLASRSHERTHYPTQKPEALLERIIQLASRPGDMVADFFCGSGTTPAVADRLGRRWLACDSGVFAIQTSRKRLLNAGAAFELWEAPGSQREWSVGAASGAPRLEARLEQAGHGWSVVLQDLIYTDRDRWPAQARTACRHWYDPLTEWEVDWNHHGDLFRPSFASRRTPADRT
ncbi:MAG: hypothetical protein KGR26_05095, partial [Cyanobacteria bacterium REEB65]|nr:hypothetical protein [Cyanobacteria bacterium REEB65]